MSDSNHNTFDSSKRYFINYLYTEVQRKSPKKFSDAFQEIIKFIETDEGKSAFEKFKSINPKKFGITSIHINSIKGIF